jgi:RNA polymerase-interacting CarD/CdnL/TRCF family regulator
MKFNEGDLVIYGSYGRCQIMGVEETQVGSEKIKCYKMKKYRKTNLPAGATARATFLVPLNVARNGVLRKPITANDADSTFDFLKTSEITASNLEGNWLTHQRKFDELIRAEGAHGMAKVLADIRNYLKGAIVPTKSIAHYYENIKKQLVDEFADAWDEPSKDVDLKVSKALKFNN